jgi:hypothetical protein
MLEVEVDDMAQLDLMVDEGLSISKLQVQLDSVTPNNDLVVRCDGLYVSGDSNDGSSIKLKQDMISYAVCTDMSPWEEAYDGDNSRFKDHVACDCCVHRCWNATWDSDNDEEKKPILISGKNEEDKFREEIDWVLPGDFFRIDKGDGNWDYYVITEVSPGPTNDICSGCGQIIYKYNDYCEHGNPNYYYDPEVNTHYTLDPPMENPEGYDAPKICQICGQPILKPQDDGVDSLIGLPGNKVVAYALLGTAGDV